MTKLETMYKEWADSVDLFKKSENQQVMMTMAFYSGVLVMFSLIEKVSEEEDEENAVHFLDATHAELKEKIQFITEQMDELYGKKDS